MHGHVCRATIAVLLPLAVATIPGAAPPPTAQTLSVSLPHLRLAKGERVIGFEVEVTSGRIASVPQVPIGWNVSIDNDPSWNTNIRASSRVGAAALGSKFFDQFLIIENKRGLAVLEGDPRAVFRPPIRIR